MRDKRQKFVDLAEARVSRTIKDLRLIGNLSNKSAYQYDQSDIQKIFKALIGELNSARAKFKGDGTGSDSEFKLED